MHDLIIRNGTVVDGSGASKFQADIAVSDGVITQISPTGPSQPSNDIVGPSHREINAEGLLVTPGWVDIHTHFDGQATWDQDLTPSSWHGVTTAVFGNCGVGFAPIRAGHESFLINLMEGVEDIPGTVLAEGVDFSWESFEQYLDVLESTPRVMDIGAQIPHGAVRFYVMGEPGADHETIPSPDELDTMRLIVRRGLAAGALGFSTSRTTKHRTADGNPSPSLSASDIELACIAHAMKEAGTGVFQVNSDFGDGEFELLRQATEISGRPLSVLLLQINSDPQRWRRTLGQIHQANADGLTVNGQVGCRPIGIMVGLGVTVDPFEPNPAYQALAHLPVAERAAALRANPLLVHALVHQRPTDRRTRWIDRMLTHTYELGPHLDYEPEPSSSIAHRATSDGLDPWQLLVDILSQGDGSTMLLHPFENYSENSLDAIREMLVDPDTICGIGDAGAHVGTICDASYPTYLLSHWTRDRTRGEQLPIEFLVNKQTRRTAVTYGLLDRGLLAPGYRADINIIDHDQIGLTQPELVFDLPAGGKRIIQRASGYHHSFVAGIETLNHGELTGERPGRLIRGTQPTP